MSKLRRLATMDDGFVQVISPIDAEELKERQELYDLLTPSKFAKRLIDSWTQPVTLVYDGQEHSIDMNFCSNPFCRWFGVTQQVYSSLPYKPSRYKLVGPHAKKALYCNPDPTDTKDMPVFKLEIYLPTLPRIFGTPRNREITKTHITKHLDKYRPAPILP